MNIILTKKIDYYLGYFFIIFFIPINFVISTIINFIPTKLFKSNIIFLKLVGGGVS
jgi:hypothetical protein